MPSSFLSSNSPDFFLIHREHFDARLISILEKTNDQNRSLKSQAAELKTVADLAVKKEKEKIREANKEKKIADALRSENEILKKENQAKDVIIARQDQQIRELTARLKTAGKKQERLDYLEQTVIPEADQAIKERDFFKKEMKKARTVNSQTGGYSSSFDVGSHSLSEKEKEECKERSKKRRKPISSRESSGLLRGGQKGHEVHRATFADKPDFVINKCSSTIPTGAVKGADESGRTYWAVQERDIKMVTVVTETRYYYCAQEKPASEGEMKSFRVSSVRYGSFFKSAALALNQFGGVSLERTCMLLNMFSSQRFSVKASSLVNWRNEFSEKCGGSIEEILERILKEPLLHVDETGVKVSGKMCWIHVICSENLCAYFITEKRSGKDGGPYEHLTTGDYSGKLVHDHFATYLTMNRVIHCECNTHVDRHLRAGVVYEECPECQQMLDLLHEMLHRKNELLKQGVSEIKDREFRTFRRRYRQICKKGLQRWEKQLEQDPGLAKLGSPDYYTTFARLKTDEENHLRFLTDFDVPYSNNRAERMIQAAKSRMKVSKQFVEMGSAKSVMNYLTLQQTMKLNGELNFLNMIHQVLEGTFHLPEKRIQPA